MTLFQSAKRRCADGVVSARVALIAAIASIELSRRRVIRPAAASRACAILEVRRFDFTGHLDAVSGKAVPFPRTVSTALHRFSLPLLHIGTSFDWVRAVRGLNCSTDDIPVRVSSGTIVVADLPVDALMRADFNIHMYYDCRFSPARFPA